LYLGSRYFLHPEDVYLCAQILIQSVCETMVPKLVAEDIPLLFSLLSDVFPNVSYTRAEMAGMCVYSTVCLLRCV
jgi:hypothetical protein